MASEYFWAAASANAIDLHQLLPALALPNDSAMAGYPYPMPHPSVTDQHHLVPHDNNNNINSSNNQSMSAHNPPIHSGPPAGRGPFVYFDGYNLTLLQHQQLLREAVKHFRPSSALNTADCPVLDMPIGNTLSMILYALVFIVGLVGNTLVIYVVVRFSKMQTVTNMYIINLAVADECFLIGIPFLMYTMQTGGWQLGKWACKAYMISTSTTQFTSSIFMFIMSADRYVAVCHPISSTRYRSPFVSKVVAALAWTASVLMMVPVFWFANTIERTSSDGSTHTTCNIEWSLEHERGGFTFTLYSFVAGFAVPLTLILVFYSLVLRKLRTVGPKSKSKEKRRSHRKVTKMVLTVIAVYVMCWLPYWISQVALINSPQNVCHSRLHVIVFLMVGLLSYSNSAMNPILYAFLSDNFKKSFMKACTCAAGKELNTQLQMEHSLFPRFGRNRGGSERGAAAAAGRNAGRAATALVDNCAGGCGRVADCPVDASGQRQCDGTDAEGVHRQVGIIDTGQLNDDVGCVDVTSESAQTKSTTISVYRSSGAGGSGSSAFGIGCGDRPPVLHTDL